jgi:hypothetical protein
LVIQQADGSTTAAPAAQQQQQQQSGISTDHRRIHKCVSLMQAARSLHAAG